MVRRDDNYFYISGIASLCIFFIVLVLFAGVLKSQKIQPFALVKDNYVSVSIALPQQRPNTRKSDTPSPVKKSKAAEPVSEPSPKKSAPDIASLFSKVDAEKITRQSKTKQPPKPVENRRISAIEQRLKTVKRNETSSVAEKVRRLRVVNASDADAGNAGSTAPQVNEYLAKIQVFVYERFYPPQGSEGSTAKIRIWLDAGGYMTRNKVLAYSNSDSFNTEVDRLMRRLDSVAFPRHPKGKAQVVEIFLIAEE